MALQVKLKQVRRSMADEALQEYEAHETDEHDRKPPRRSDAKRNSSICKQVRQLVVGFSRIRCQTAEPRYLVVAPRSRKSSELRSSRLVREAADAACFVMLVGAHCAGLRRRADSDAAMTPAKVIYCQGEHTVSNPF